MKNTANASETAPTAATGMLDEPTLSRQWVARRLQRALTVERWAGPARAGLSRTRAPIGSQLADDAAASAARAGALEELIRTVGSEPYPSYGIGAPLTRVATSLVGHTSAWASRKAACFLATHTLGEYRALVAFVDDAAGVPTDLVDRIRPMQAESQQEFETLGCRMNG